MRESHLKNNKYSLAWIFRIIDLLLILASFYIATIIFSLNQTSNKFELPIQHVVFIVIYLITWIFLSIRLNLYSSKRVSFFRYEIWDIINSTFICLIIAIILLFFVQEFFLSHLLLVSFWLIQLMSLIFTRLFLRELLKYIRRLGFNYRQVLMVGFNERTLKLMQVIDESPEFGIKILGYIDEENQYKNSQIKKNDMNFFGSLDRLEEILCTNVVDEVLITLPVKSFYNEIEQIVTICQVAGIEVIMPVHLFSLHLSRSALTHFGNVPVLNLFSGPPMNLELVLKRFVDIIISTFLIILCIPIFIGTSIAIILSSRGPLLFKQERVGYNGRRFTLLKFRTMVAEAETLKPQLLKLNESEGPVFKIKNDPRITRVGRILRNSSFDELPQLINVFIGEMSLVGPRPPIPSEVDLYDLQHRRRLSMKPGITCIWQVNGRNNIPFEKWMELDKHYIDNWSLWLDIKILLKTIPVVIKGTGQ